MIDTYDAHGRLVDEPDDDGGWRYGWPPHVTAEKRARVAEKFSARTCRACNHTGGMGVHPWHIGSACRIVLVCPDCRAMREVSR